MKPKLITRPRSFFLTTKKSNIIKGAIKRGPTQFFFQVRDVSSVIRKRLEHFEPLVQVFVGRIIFDHFKKVCSEDP